MVTPKRLHIHTFPHRRLHWLPAVLAVPTLFLALVAPYRTATEGSAAWERRNLQAFINILHTEGSVRSIALCHDFEVCVHVTLLFEELTHGDQRRIGALIQRYFEIRPGGPSLAPRIRFMEAQTGIELGSYADGRLHWHGEF